jgi:hypothetical protein
LSCYYLYIVLSLYLYCCYVVYLDHHFTVISVQTCYRLHSNSTSIKIKQYRGNNKTNTDYTSLNGYYGKVMMSCYYLYIVLSLYLYCCYVVYTDHHFTVISLQTFVVCVCLVITYTSLNRYYRKVMICIHNIATVQV